MGPSPLAL
jgi:hypothetical protein